MIRVRPLTAADLPAGLALSRQAGWNQTPADWRRALDLEPDGCFAAEVEGAFAGTATTCVFGPVAWVAMVLVNERFRRRGVGRALMERALAWLDAAGVRTVRLDATPLGQPLYEQLGFVSQFSLTRFAGALAVPAPSPFVAGFTATAVPPEQPASGGAALAATPATGGQRQDDHSPPGERAAEVATAPPERWEDLAALDEAVTRTDRRKLLLRLFAEWPEEVRAAPGGLLAARRGFSAVQLGPCLGAAGPVLLQDAARRHAGERVYLDVPVDNAAAVRLAEGLGLAEQRRLVRMCRGAPVVEDVGRLWASSGPENG